MTRLFGSRQLSRKSSRLNKRLRAFLQALLVVALWSASPPLAKLTYRELEPVQVTAIRYVGAALVLLPIAVSRSLPRLKSMGTMDWMILVIMGVLGFSVGNTILYIGLETLPATTTSFLLNGIPIATVLLGLLTLGEKPRAMQWFGIFLALVGGSVFFGWRVAFDQRPAILLSLLGVLSISIYGLLARRMTRLERIDPVSLSAIPMGIGGLLLVVFILPIPHVSGQTVGILMWLTLVNSALAFVIWNNALKCMQAFEISVTGNLMPIGTAILAPIMLGEAVAPNAWIGMVISLIGVVLVGVGGREALFKTRVV